MVPNFLVEERFTLYKNENEVAVGDLIRMVNNHSTSVPHTSIESVSELNKS